MFSFFSNQRGFFFSTLLLLPLRPSVEVFEKSFTCVWPLLLLLAPVVRFVTLSSDVLCLVVFFL